MGRGTSRGPPSIGLAVLGRLVVRFHNVGSSDGNVDVVLVWDASEWPNLAGTRGIESFHVRREAQDPGDAQPDIPTNIWLEFTAER